MSGRSFFSLSALTPQFQEKQFPYTGGIYWISPLLQRANGFRIVAVSLRDTIFLRPILRTFLLVPEVGLEPTNLAAHDFESCMFTNFITPASVLLV